MEKILNKEEVDLLVSTATNAILSAAGQILSTMNLLNFLK